MTTKNCVNDTLVFSHILNKSKINNKKNICLFLPYSTFTLCFVHHYERKDKHVILQEQTFILKLHDGLSELH